MRSGEALTMALQLFGPNAALQRTTSASEVRCAVGTVATVNGTHAFQEAASGRDWTETMFRAMAQKMGVQAAGLEHVAMDLPAGAPVTEED